MKATKDDLLKVLRRAGALMSGLHDDWPDARIALSVDEDEHICVHIGDSWMCFGGYQFYEVAENDAV